jgi:hypothetical protein
MKKKHIITLAILLLLTLLTAIVAGFNHFALLILALSAIKFLLVAFQFMELKKAHVFWKVSIVFIVLLITGIIAVIK